MSVRFRVYMSLEGGGDKKQEALAQSRYLLSWKVGGL